MAYAPTRARNAALLASAGPSDVAQVIHQLPTIAMFSIYVKIFVLESDNILKIRMTSTAVIAWLLVVMPRAPFCQQLTL
jgi:hypothetical protein